MNMTENHVLSKLLGHASNCPYVQQFIAIRWTCSRSSKCIFFVNFTRSRWTCEDQLFRWPVHMHAYTYIHTYTHAYTYISIKNRYMFMYAYMDNGYVCVIYVFVWKRSVCGLLSSFVFLFFSEGRGGCIRKRERRIFMSWWLIRLNELTRDERWRGSSY